MKRFISFFILLFAFVILKSQTIIAKWTFEDATKRDLVNLTGNATDYTPDEGSGSLYLVGGPTLNLSSGSYFASGSGGTGTYAINAKGWDNGVNTKAWLFKVSTINMQNIKFSSKQRSSNTGPKDFKLQYSLDSLEWIDLQDIVVTTSFPPSVTPTQLPSACDNRLVLYIRLVVSSTIAAINDGSTVAANGTNRIDDIVIEGSPMSTKTVSFGVEQGQGTIKAFVNEYEIQSPAQVAVGSDVVFVAFPQKPNRVDYWKVNNDIIPNYTNKIYTHYNLQDDINVQVAFVEAISATLDRYIDTIDLGNLEDIDFLITWNDATQVDSLEALIGNEHFLLEPGIDYEIIGDTLRFYLSEKKSQFVTFYTVTVRVYFDIGLDRDITFEVGSMAYAVNYSVATGQGQLNAYAYYFEFDDTLYFNSGDLVPYVYELYFEAIPSAGYKIQKWTIDGEDVLDENNELYTNNNLVVTFDDEIDVKVYFEETQTLSQIFTKQFTLHPNPTNKLLHINAQGEYSYQIYSITGLMVLEGKLTNAGVIDLSMLANGVYNIFLTNSKETVTSKFVKK